MKLFKRIATLSLVSLVLPAQMALASGKTIDHYVPMDLEYNHWAYEEIDDLINAEIVEGYLEDMGDYTDMYVKPEANITRAEFVKIVVTSLGLKSGTQPASFSDVKTGSWYYSYVSTASSLGIVNGYDNGKFGANDPVTRDQITAIIVRAFKDTIIFPKTSPAPFTDVPSSYWAYENINKASGAGIVKGITSTTFKPQNKATRAQAFVMLHRALNKETSALPDKQVLAGLVENQVKHESDLLTANDFHKLAGLYTENTTGFYRTTGLDTAEIYQNIVNSGGKVIFTGDNTNMDSTAESVHTRFASIMVTGADNSLTIKEGTSSYGLMNIFDGLYNLKKDSNSGEWKIYSFYPMY